MLLLSRLARRLRVLRHFSAVERAMDDEMRHHIECETHERIANGESPADARRAALVQFGGVERFKEEARDARGARAAHDLAYDTRHALRVLRRSPGFAAATVLTLALGIGATAAIFSVVRGVVLAPLPYSEPGRLVVIWTRNAARSIEHNVSSIRDYEAWRERSRSFSGLAALVPAPMTLTGANVAERVAGAQVSPGYFGILRARPMLGRTLRPSDETPGSNVAVLSYDLWVRQMRGDRAIVGQAISLDNVPYTVVGVMPRDFDPPRFGWMGQQDLFIPLPPTQQYRSWGRAFAVLGRLRDGVSIDGASAEMRGLAAQLGAEAADDRGWSVSLRDLTGEITGDVRTPLYVLLAAVGLLLLMGVVNVANLTLAHVRRRESELALRVALGASGGRVVRQLLTQSAVVALAGGTLGLLAAWGSLGVLVRLLPSDVPRTGSIAIDGVVLAVALAVSTTAALACALIPAARAIRGAAGTRLRDGARVSSSGRGSALVIAEVALALVLTIAGGLAMRSFVALRRVALGFDPTGVVTMRIALPMERYKEAAQRRAFFDDVLAAARATPGVQVAGATSLRPLYGGGPRTTMEADGRPFPAGAEPPSVDVRYASGDYFKALRIPLLAGRVMDARDRADAPPRAVVSSELARTLWPGESAVGRRVVLKLNGGIVAEVIGVVGDSRITDPRTPASAIAYLPDGQSTGNSIDLMLRGAADEAAMATAMRAAVATLDPTLPVFQIATMETIVARATASERFTAVLLVAFALSSLLLAAVGIYGMCSGDVVRRRRELGIRLALGARPRSIVALVLTRGVASAAVGVAIGIVASLALTRAMRAMLFGVSATDPLSFAAVAALLLLIATVATLWPALRAARIGPSVAMREE